MTYFKVIYTFCLIFIPSLSFAAEESFNEHLIAQADRHFGSETTQEGCRQEAGTAALGILGNPLGVGQSVDQREMHIPDGHPHAESSLCSIEQYSLILTDKLLFALHDLQNTLLTPSQPNKANVLKNYCKAQVSIHSLMVASVGSQSLRAYCNLCWQIATWPDQLSRKEINLEVCQKIKSLQAIRCVIIKKLDILNQTTIESLIALCPSIKSQSTQLNLFIALLQDIKPSQGQIEELYRKCQRLRTSCCATLSKILKKVEYDEELRLIFLNMIKKIEKNARAFTDLIITLDLCKSIFDESRARVLKDCCNKAMVLSCKLYLDLVTIGEYIELICKHTQSYGPLSASDAEILGIMIRKDYPLTNIQLQTCKHVIGILFGDAAVSDEIVEETTNSNSDGGKVQPLNFVLPELKALEPINNSMSIPQQKSDLTDGQHTQHLKTMPHKDQSIPPQNSKNSVERRAVSNPSAMNASTTSMEKKRDDDELVIESVDLKNVTDEFMDLVMGIQGPPVNFLIPKISSREQITLILYGVPGVGKTAAAQVLAKKLQLADITHGMPPRKVFYINIARCRNYYKDSIQTVLEKTLKNLCGQNAIIILDEIDAIAEVQEIATSHTDKGISGLFDLLKQISFIAIANYIEWIPPLIKSRLGPFIEIVKPNSDQRIKILKYYLWQNENKLSYLCLQLAFIEELANKTEDFSIRDLENIIKWAEQAKFRRTSNSDSLILPEDLVQATRMERPGLTTTQMLQIAKQTFQNVDEVTRNPIIANIALKAIFPLFGW